MRHPTEGDLRRLVDEPAGVTDADRAHVASCPTCLQALEEIRADARLVDSALAPAADGIDLDAAWARLTATEVAGRRQSSPRSRRSWRTAVRRPAVAVVSAAVLVGGAGVAAANDWLPIFQTERVDPVELTSTELVQLPDLSAYGDLDVPQEPGTEQVADAAAAYERTGLTVPGVAELPEGVTGEPTYQAADVVSATFTFSAAKAAQAAAAEGEVLPPPPAGVDGAALRLQAGPGVAAVWSQPTGAPTLVVARVVAPQVYSSGVPYEVVRDYLLSLPGLPDGLADQLRELSADASTLPLPVPAELVTSSSADVDGADATVLTSRDGLFAAVMWVEDGVVTGVAGSLSAEELLTVARDLR
ncbi:hypothetical protein [Geodermatophilus sabuli]|uniref:DUF4367 domain-containing protein n=1 Tax=Geodermatophilus sabuli TaxID=1564158 RepID=A0A285E8K7_9ACTN|nr:hypothetical protein [Geodermatophilus sabuli]MBB3082698.1 hypothetical protein [Geodermatophilus sabuli]SNX94436.1 hypothetical protein SAMN06893097_101229 [Geodermatophilus sabuli]